MKPSNASSQAPPQPPLPPIRDPVIRSAVFTHQGMLSSLQNATQLASYERYEFLGDAYVELFAKRLLYNKFPEMSVSRLSALKDTLVMNETLAIFTTMYKLNKEASLPPDLYNHSRRQKIYGDLFEAYIAGIILSDPEHGEKTAEDWLKKLWEPMLRNAKEEQVAKNGREALRNKLGGTGVRLDYRDDGHPQQLGNGQVKFYMAVYLTGWGWENQVLGKGHGLNKKEASQTAAFAALNNRPLIDDIAKMKIQHDEHLRKDVEVEAVRNGRSYDEQIQINRKTTTDKKARMSGGGDPPGKATKHGRANQDENQAGNQAKRARVETDKLPWM